MHAPSVVLTPRARGLIAVSLFLIAWWLGTASVIGAYELEGPILFSCTFALAALLWRISYRISRSVNGRGMTLGAIVLSLWMLSLSAALLIDFRHFVRDPFFWTSSTILLVLVAALAVSDARKVAENATKS